MLNIDLFKRFEHDVGRLSSLLPWMMLYKNDAVLNKDGALLVCYQCDGVSSLNLRKHGESYYAEKLETAFSLFDSRFSVWWQCDHRQSHAYPDSDFINPVSEKVNRLWKDQILKEAPFKNNIYLGICFSMPHKSDNFFDNFLYFYHHQRYSLLKAFAFSTKSMLSMELRFLNYLERIEIQYHKFMEILSGFEGILSENKLKRLEGRCLLGFLEKRASNPVAQIIKSSNLNIPCYLDSILGNETLKVHPFYIEKIGHRSTYIRAISIKGWPGFTFPGMLEGLLKIKGNITISQCFRYVSKEDSKRYIARMRRYHKNTEKPFQAYLWEALSRQKSGYVNQGKHFLSQDAEKAMGKLETHHGAYGHYALTVLAYAACPEEAENLIQEVGQTVSAAGFSFVYESLHLLSAWACTLPGQWALSVRWSFIHSANFADLCPIRSGDYGDLHCAHLSKQRQQQQPCLTMFKTVQQGTPAYFNLFHQDAGHTLVIGPTRAGKSVFCNFLMAQFLKYQPCQIFIFDKDYSCKVPTLLQGGTYIDLSRGESTHLFNPLKYISDPAARIWLEEWLFMLLKYNHFILSAQQMIEIRNAITFLAQQPQKHWQLSSLTSFLSTELADQLSPWLSNSEHPSLFDNVEDTFSMSSFMCLESSSLFQENSAMYAYALLDYIFYRIHERLNGVPAIIYIEEAWFFLASPLFSAKINEWLRTLAKKNACIILATQSLGEITQHNAMESLIDNIPNKIFLSNAQAQAHHEKYRDIFGLSDAQINIIKSLIPKSEYYICTPSQELWIDARFDKNILSYLRSDPLAQSIISRCCVNGKVNSELYHREILSEI